MVFEYNRALRRVLLKMDLMNKRFELPYEGMTASNHPVRQD